MSSRTLIVFFVEEFDYLSIISEVLRHMADAAEFGVIQRRARIARLGIVAAVLTAAIAVVGIGARPALAAPNLLLDKKASSTVAGPGSVITYTIRYRCGSLTENCLGVSIVDDINPFASIVDYTRAGGLIHNVSRVGNSVRWTMKDPLPAGSTGLVTVQVKFPVCASGQPANPINNSATISASNADPYTDATDAAVTVSPVPACQPVNPEPPANNPFRKYPVNALPAPGGIITWQVNAPSINADANVATPSGPYVIQDMLPAGTWLVQLLSYDDTFINCGSGWFQIPDAGLVEWMDSAAFPGTSGCVKQLVPIVGNSTVSAVTNATGIRGYWFTPQPARMWDSYTQIRLWLPLDTPAYSTRSNCAQYFLAPNGGAGTVGAALSPATCSTYQVRGRAEPLLYKRIIAAPGDLLNEPQTADPSWLMDNGSYPPIAESPADGIVVGQNDLAFSLRTYLQSTSPGVKTPVITDLLDEGLRFTSLAEGASNWWRSHISAAQGQFPAGFDPSSDPDCVNPSFEVLDDYAGTGRQLLRWTFDGCDLPSAPFDVEPLITVYFSAAIIPGRQPGEVLNNNFHFGSKGTVVSDGPTQCAGTMDSATYPYEDPWAETMYDAEELDVLDRDGDGDVTEYVCRSRVVNYTVPIMSAIDSSKWVMGQLDTQWTRYPQFGDAIVGEGSTTYEIRLSNAGNTEIAELDLIDILPFVGDTAVTDLTADGIPVARESKWGQELTSLTSVMFRPNAAAPYAAMATSDYTVGFTMAKNPCRWDTDNPQEPNRLTISSGVFDTVAGVSGPTDCLAADWDATQFGARAMAFQYHPGTPLPAGGSLIIRFKARIAAGEAPDAPYRDRIAWNSAGYAGVTTEPSPNQALLSTEPLKVGTHLVDPTTNASIGDWVWIDLNHDGQQNDGATGVPGVLVSLYEGPTLLQTTITDVNGLYRFDGLDEHTTYEVRLARSSDFLSGGALGRYQLTAGNAASVDDALDSDALIVDGIPTITSATSAAAGSHTSTFDFGFWLPASLGDYVWDDRAANGSQDLGEPGIAGVTVTLHRASDNSTVTTTTTDASGRYFFDDLVANGYYVRFDPTTAVGAGAGGQPYSGYTFTLADSTGNDENDSDADGDGRTTTVVLNAGDRDVTWDAGMTPPATPPPNAASLGDYTWIDVNANGRQDDGEPPVGGVRVVLYDSNGFPVQTATTESDGHYLFDELDPDAVWQLQFGEVGGFRRTEGAAFADGTDATNNSDANSASGMTDMIPPLGAGTFDPTWDAGFVPVFSLGNTVWADTNDNGIIDATALSERGIPDLKVRLYLADGTTEVEVGPDGAFGTADDAAGGVRTNAFGSYLFTGLAAGDYVVAIDAPIGYLSSTGNGLDPNPVGPNEAGAAIDEDASPIDGDDNGHYDATTATIRSLPVTLAFDAEPLGESATPGIVDLSPDGESNYQLDFGLIQVLELGNRVWVDTEATPNGEFDEGTDETIVGATVRLYADVDGDGTPDGPALATTKTDSEGLYRFSNVLAGGYIVEVDNRTMTIDGLPNPIAGQSSTTDTATSGDPNSDVDGDDNGVNQTPTGIRTGTVALTVGDEPLDEDDPASGDNGNSNLSVDFGLMPRYDLALAKVSDLNEAALPGDAITWTVRAVNQGVVPSGDFTVVDRLPLGLNAPTAISNGGTFAGGMITWELGGLDPSESLDLTFTTTVADMAAAPFRNWAEITEDAADDADSTPDSNTGNGATPPNDSFVAIDDLATIDVNGQPTGDEDDNDDATVIAATQFSIGNMIWSDTGAGPAFNNGVRDAGEQTIAGVTVQLFAADGDGEPTGTALSTVATGPAGEYRFDDLLPGRYVVVTPASNFTGSGALVGFRSSNGAATTFVLVDDTHDHGIDVDDSGLSEVRSAPLTLGLSNPLGEIEPGSYAASSFDGAAATDGHNNLTADFGFITLYDLALIKTTPSTAPVAPNSTITWDVVVINQGTQASGAYTVIDNIPAGLTYVANSATDGGTLDASGDLVWNLSALAPGQRKSLTFSTTVSEARLAPFRNWAEITTDGGIDEDSTPDSNIGADDEQGVGATPNDPIVDHNNESFDSGIPATFSEVDEDDNDFAVAAVDVRYDLALATVTSAALVIPGEEITYSIKIVNQGNVPSGAFSVLDRLSSATTFIAASHGGVHVDGVVTWTDVASIAPSSSITVTVTVRVDSIDVLPLRTWAEIIDDDANSYGRLPNGALIADIDSTPDSNTGTDAALPNDAYVAVNDLSVLDVDGQPVGDEDDNDDAAVSGDVQYDLALVKVADVGTATIGGSVNFTVAVKNQGTVSAHDFVITDRLPVGMAFVTGSASDAGAHTAGVLTWAMSDLAPGATKSVTFSATVTDMTKRGFRNWAEISADSSADYSVSDADSTPNLNTGSDQALGVGVAPDDAFIDQGIDGLDIDNIVGDEDDNDLSFISGDAEYDLALVKESDLSGPADPDQNVGWTLTVRNQGTVASHQFEVSDAMPAGMGYVADSCAGAPCSMSAGLLTWTVPDLPAGQAVVLSYSTTIVDTTKSPYRNWAEISAHSASDYGLDTVDADSTPDGDTGRDATLPNDAYVGATVADLASDAVAGDEDDNDDATVSLDVDYDLALVKTAAVATIAPDEQATFIIRVRNQGNVNSRGFTVTDRLPTGMSFVSADNGGAFADGLVTWTFPDAAGLGPDGEIDLRVTVAIDDLTQRPFRNWAEISGNSAADYGAGNVDGDSTSDLTTGVDDTLPNDAYQPIAELSSLATNDTVAGDEDDNDDAVVDVAIEYDLALIKTAAAARVAPGGAVEFTITLANQGNVASGEYTITDTLPAGLNFVSASDGGVHANGIVTWRLGNVARGATRQLTVAVSVADVTMRPFRNIVEISDDSADRYGHDPTSGLAWQDEDSTPDANTGSDPGAGIGTTGNDLVVNHDDIFVDNRADDEDDHDHADFDIDVRYDVALVKVAATPVVEPTGEITWTLRVLNQGNVPARGLTVSDTMPSGLSFVSASHGGALAANGVVRWQLSDLAPGVSTDLTLIARVSDARLSPFRNWAEVSDDSSEFYGVGDLDSIPDGNTGKDNIPGNDALLGRDDLSLVSTDLGGDEDDSDDATTRLNVVYDLALAKILKPGQTISADGLVVYQIIVKNQGNVNSGRFTVADTIPVGMALTLVSHNGSSLGREVAWTVENLAPDEAVTLELTVRLIDNGQATYTNWAEISSDSAATYGPGVRDEDSVPDGNIGADATPPNDAVIDQVNADADFVAGDEDDNDLAVLTAAQINRTPPPTTPKYLPETGVMIIGTLMIGGLLLFGGLGVRRLARRRAV